MTDGEGSSSIQTGIMAALSVVGGVDDRPRLGGQVVGPEGPVGTVVRVSGCCRLVAQMPTGDTLRVRLPAVKVSPGAAFALDRLPLSEPLLGAWAQLVAVCTQAAPPPVTPPHPPHRPAAPGHGLDPTLLRAQQVQLAALRACRLLFRHQTRLRRYDHPLYILFAREAFNTNLPLTRVTMLIAGCSARRSCRPSARTVMRWVTLTARARTARAATLRATPPATPRACCCTRCLTRRRSPRPSSRTSRSKRSR